MGGSGEGVTIRIPKRLSHIGTQTPDHHHKLVWVSDPNGKSDGVNGATKTLIERAYGYRNFRYFRLKVLQKCGYLMDYSIHSF